MHFEKDPFPDLLKEQVATVLYEVNNALLQKLLWPRGGVRDMMVEYDYDAELSLEGSNLCGLLHHKQIVYPTWQEEWDKIGV